MNDREEQQAAADVQALCAKYGQLVMLRVMGRMQFQWARQGLALLGTEGPSAAKAAPHGVAPGKKGPLAAAIGNVVKKLEERHGESEQ